MSASAMSASRKLMGLTAIASRQCSNSNWAGETFPQRMSLRVGRAPCWTWRSESPRAAASAGVSACGFVWLGETLLERSDSAKRQADYFFEAACRAVENVSAQSLTSEQEKLR